LLGAKTELAIIMPAPIANATISSKKTGVYSAPIDRHSCRYWHRTGHLCESFHKVGSKKIQAFAGIASDTQAKTALV
jgi:hypothetical protein